MEGIRQPALTFLMMGFVQILIPHAKDMFHEVGWPQLCSSLRLRRDQQSVVFNRKFSMAAEQNKPGQVKLLTLAIVHRDGRVLLGMKKRGFGEGYFNGFGGKVENGETIEQAAAREMEEEAGIKPLDLEKRGVLTFHFDDKPIPWEVHVYNVGNYTGEPCETEEMSPRWFLTSDIPFEKMWKDDPIWYPHFLQGSLFRGEFHFRNTHELVSQSFEVVSRLPGS